MGHATDQAQSCGNHPSPSAQATMGRQKSQEQPFKVNPSKLKRRTGSECAEELTNFFACITVSSRRRRSRCRLCKLCCD